LLRLHATKKEMDSYQIAIALSSLCAYDKLMSYTIITGDCREVMPTLDRESIRLIFADPPYNQGVQYGSHYNDKMSAAVYLAWSESWLRAAVPLLTRDGSLWLLVSHKWAYKIAPIAENAGLHLRQWIIWYETFGQNRSDMFNCCTRPLLWFTRDRKTFVFNANAPEIRRPSDRQLKYKDKRANPNGKLLDDIWGIPRVCGTFRERVQGVPTQVPVELVRRVVACASDPGDLVLDPFAGSGTTGVACIELGRQFIGIEGSKRFAELARNRLASFIPPFA
jgi:site-specific DNA-methyltransferase (adenine-specific)